MLADRLAFYPGFTDRNEYALDLSRDLTARRPGYLMTPSFPTIAHFETSMAILPEASALRRKPRASMRARPQEFMNAFEDRILFYDCFRYGDDGQILLIGPPPHNLADVLQAADFVAHPSGRSLNARMYPSRSTMITCLSDAPDDTTSVSFTLDDHRYHIVVQPDSTTPFSDRRVLFTINKNNRLDWISAWANWHVRTQGTDAILLFDNGSTDYTIEDIEKRLAAVEGLRTIAVIALPYKFGPIDKWVFAYHFWPRFLQISATSLALRRFGMRAKGLINCDIDELMWGYGRSIYEMLEQDGLGVLRIPGQWMESAFQGSDPQDHFDFRYRLKGLAAKLSPPKCAIDPRRDWVRNLRVQPYLHRVHGAPSAARKLTDRAKFWHFRGINTNWKEDRTSATQIDPYRHLLDKEWLNAAGLNQSD